MTEIKNRLFQAFKADHALLGSGFYALATSLRDKNIVDARQVAAKISAEAGPHIAFEEEVFYPALERFIGEQELTDLYAEHEQGRTLLESILELDETEELNDSVLQELLTAINKIEAHIASCGELFGMMGGLTENEMQELLDELKAYRLKGPNWLSLKSAK